MLETMGSSGFGSVISELIASSNFGRVRTGDHSLDRVDMQMLPDELMFGW